MRVTMTTTKSCYPDGIHSATLEAGQTYDLTTRLGESFVANGLATKPAGKAELTVVPPAGEATIDDTVKTETTDPIEGLNAKKSVEAIAALNAEQLAAIPDDSRKTVTDAIVARNAELEADANTVT